MRFLKLTQMGIALSVVVNSFGAANPALADGHNVHHFDMPYQCDRSREVTSSRTGEVRTVHYRSVYFPQMDWRIDLTDVWDAKDGLGGRGIANLHAPTVRYDGVYRDDGSDITLISMSSAWPREDNSPGVSLRRSADDDIARCAVLSDDQIAFYRFDYLGDLEVMGQ